MKIDLFRPVYSPRSIEIQRGIVDMPTQKARQTVRNALAQGWYETREKARGMSLTPMAWALKRAFPAVDAALTTLRVKRLYDACKESDRVGRAYRLAAEALDSADQQEEQRRQKELAESRQYVETAQRRWAAWKAEYAALIKDGADPFSFAVAD